MAIKIDKAELTFDNVKEVYELFKSHLEDNPIEIDFKEVKKVELPHIQMILSLKKYCESHNKELKLLNIESNQMKEEFKLFKLL
jgi:MFS superfamily sulfate permease-like transporter